MLHASSIDSAGNSFFTRWGFLVGKRGPLKVDGQTSSCLHSDASPSFALCLPSSASRELRQNWKPRNHTAARTHTHTVRGDCASQVNGDDLLLGSAPRTATVAHVNSPNGPLHPPKCVFFLAGGKLNSFWLLTIIMFRSDLVSHHLLGVIWHWSRSPPPRSRATSSAQFVERWCG